jgi:(4S)-4-hydroxy-5-phosphonooxypentane-2,3-dione isomerase
VWPLAATATKFSRRQARFVMALRCGPADARPQISRSFGENLMRKLILKCVAAAGLLAGTMILASIHGRFQSDADLDALLGMSAAAQAGGVYVNAIDLVIIPSEMAKYVEAIKENAANAVKEPGCREFNVLVMPNRPNHVFLFEVYDNEAALAAHRNTEHLTFQEIRGHDC